MATSSSATTTTNPTRSLEAPEAAFERQLRYLLDGQASRAYKEIHPAQQAFISSTLYQRCASVTGGYDLLSSRIVEVFDEELTIPGTDLVVASKAITVELSIQQGLLTSKGTDTYHEVLVDGAWRFTVSSAEALKAGKCS